MKGNFEDVEISMHCCTYNAWNYEDGTANKVYIFEMLPQRSQHCQKSISHALTYLYSILTVTTQLFSPTKLAFKITMPNDIGMNKIVCSDEGRSGIRNAPVDPVENYPIYRGCGIGGRNHDIQTSQTLSNGVVLYYTATTGSSRRTTKTSSTIRGRRPSPSSGGLTKPAQLATKRRTRASAASPHELGGVRTHQGLGALDELPVPPEVIMSHGGVRGMQAAAFVELCSGIARRCPVLAFQKDRSDDKDEMVNRTAGFTYFWLDVNGFARAMGGRSRGARCATQACQS